jgi:3-oxoacyl-[acyl-carrier protein] reductase
MELGLKERVAVVCAASQGLGKATALALATEGAVVVICGRDKARIVNTAKEIRTVAGNSTVMPVVADVSNPKEIKQLFSRVIRTHKRLDILVTNAGGPPGGQFLDLTDKDWDTGIHLNLMSTIRCIREAIPWMQKRKWGRIINITSLTVKQPVNDLIISSTVRPGILGLSKILANLYGREGITVNNVAPGFIMTGRQKELSRLRAGKKGIPIDRYIEDVSKDIPAGRFGTPQELADVITFLASERAGYINGATVSVDGGLIKGLF